MKIQLISVVLCLLAIDASTVFAQAPGGSKTAPGQNSQQNWAFGASKVAFPKTPASGKVHGLPFKVETALLADDVLTLKQGSKQRVFADREFMICLSNKKKLPMENSSFTMPIQYSGGSCYMSWVPSPNAPPITKSFFPSECGMKLQFGRKQANGLLPGYIVLRVPDAEGSYVQGYFYAQCK